MVGADAAGMSAAHQALRTAKAAGRALEVVALESTTHTSYSACGLPYWVAGDVDDADDLVARTAQQHREAGVDLRLRHRVDHLDLATGTAVARDLDADEDVRVRFDQVLLATGAEALRPDWATPERESDGVQVLKTLDDGAALRSLLARRRPTTAVVVGGGYIGVEAAESLARLGLRTTLVSQGEQVMTSTLVRPLADLVRAGLERAGVEVVLGRRVASVAAGAEGVRAVHLDDDRELPAEVVVVGVGVAPRTGLATAAGVPVGGDDVRGALVPDDHQRVTDGVWAAGDCAAVTDLVTGRPRFVPLGTHANKAGKVAGTNLGGGDAAFAGVVGTAITRAGELEVSRTGLMPADAEVAGLRTREVVVGSTTASGYMPQSDPITIWALGEEGTGTPARAAGRRRPRRRQADRRRRHSGVARPHGCTGGRPRPRLRPAVLPRLGPGPDRLPQARRPALSSRPAVLPPSRTRTGVAHTVDGVRRAGRCASAVGAGL